MNSTRTYAILEVTPAVFAEIREKLKSAGYDHALLDDTIDMHDIALRSASPASPPETLLPGSGESA